MKPSLTSLLTILITLHQTATAQSTSPQAQPATLTAHAILPAQTYLTPPTDASPDFSISGKFTTATRQYQPHSITAHSNNRPTNLKLPFPGQPIQGHSGINIMADGTLWLLTDNGFGNKRNSTDAMLFLSHYRPNWQTGTLTPLETIFLHDPDRRIPFRIINESTPKRYLSGGDFDPESLQITEDRIWIGEEFGPYLIEANRQGKILNIHPLELNGKPIYSPDHPTHPKPESHYHIKRSKGFEGMAKSPNGRYLYPLLEGPIYNPKSQTYEQSNGKTALRIFEFDTTLKRYTSRSWLYPLEHPDHAIGDFTMIDENHGLIIERDNLEGTTAYPCTNSTTTHCFSQPAQFKRIYKIKLDHNQTNQPIQKLAYIDLMNINDPNKIARKPLVDGKFVFPFFTIENIGIIDNQHIIVGNDNNLPFSSSRHPNQVDDNELIILNVGHFLHQH